MALLATCDLEVDKPTPPFPRMKIGPQGVGGREGYLKENDFLCRMSWHRAELEGSCGAGQ